MSTLLVALAMAVTAIAQQTAAVAPANDPRERLETAIEEAIRLLDAKEIPRFLATFSPPEALAKRRDTIDEFARRFAQKGADRLLATLKQIRATKPSISADGNTATYLVEPASERGPGTLRWEKIGKYWYIAN